MATEVRNMDELKKAIESKVEEIVSYNEEVVSKLKTIQNLKTYGPAAIGVVVAAIPIIVSTGGLGVGLASGLLSFAAPSAGSAISIAMPIIIGLVAAVGAAIVISLFTDWEYFEAGRNGIKMKRKKR